MWVHILRAGAIADTLEQAANIARWLADIMAAQTDYPASAYGFSGRGSKKRRADYLFAVQQGYSK